MPVLWQSSQKPMYVRTVWVEGFRHAILTQSDPHFLKLVSKRRPNSSFSYASKRNVNSPINEDRLENSFRNLNLVVSSEKSNLRTKFQQKSLRQPAVERLNLNGLTEDLEEDLLIKSNAQHLCELQSSRSKFNNICLNMKTLRSNRTARSEVKEDTELSERVLQWLDLAGKVDLLAPENVERMSQPRHSWPGIQKRNLPKSKTALELRPKEVKSSPNVEIKQSSSIDRHDFYVPTSANTIETYAKQSRTVRSTPRNETSTKTREQLKLKTKDIRSNIAEAQQKVALERNAVEKQYAELLSKKMKPDMGKGTKKTSAYIHSVFAEKEYV